MTEITDIERNKPITMPDGYVVWRKNIETLIEQAKLRAIMSVNSELLTLYWHIGREILEKQRQQGWGAQVISQLSKDLTARFPDDRGYSERNLRNMLLIIPIIQFCKSHLPNCRNFQFGKWHLPNYKTRQANLVKCDLTK